MDIYVWYEEGSSKKQECSRKTSISALLTMPKPLTVWITTNCGKFLKTWEYQTTLPASWEICMQVKKPILRRQRNSRWTDNRLFSKLFDFVLFDFDCVDHNKLWQILRDGNTRSSYLPPTSWEICMQQQLKPDMEQRTGSKLGKEYIKAVYCHPAYLTSMQSTSRETLGWKKHKLESRLLGEIPVTSDMQMTPPLWQKVKN